MTKEQLCQFSWLKLEIEDLTYRIRKIENILHGGASRFDSMPWLGEKKDTLGNFLPQLVDLQDSLQSRRAQALLEIKRLEQFIQSIDDSQLRQIFTLRYIDNLSWHQVAWRLGGNTADSARMSHNRFLQKLNEKT